MTPAHKLCLILLALCLQVSPCLLAQDTVRPMYSIPGRLGESQVDEDAGHWVIRNSLGLKTVDIETGETRAILEGRLAGFGSTENSRLLTADAKIFGYLSSDYELLTLGRVETGETLQQMSVRDLLHRPRWGGYQYLADDGSYLITDDYAADKRVRIVRIDLTPSPRVTATYKCGRRQAISVSTSLGGLVLVTPTGGRDRQFRVFNDKLELLHRQKLAQLWGVSSVVDSEHPLVLLTWRDPHRWQLVGRGEREYVARSPVHTPREYFCTGLISPGGRWVVISLFLRQQQRPLLTIWSAVSGKLAREVIVDGGPHRLSTDAAIKRLAFSKSGRYLCASDAGNSYLFEFNELLTSETSALGGESGSGGR